MSLSPGVSSRNFAGSPTRGILAASSRISIQSFTPWFLTIAFLFLTPFIAWDIFRKECATALKQVHLTDVDKQNLGGTLIVLYIYWVLNLFLCQKKVFKLGPPQRYISALWKNYASSESKICVKWDKCFFKSLDKPVNNLSALRVEISSVEVRKPSIFGLLERWKLIPNFLALDQVKWFERRFYHRSHASFIRPDRLAKLIEADIFTMFILGAGRTSLPMRTSVAKAEGCSDNFFLRAVVSKTTTAEEILETLRQNGYLPSNYRSTHMLATLGRHPRLLSGSRLMQGLTKDHTSAHLMEFPASKFTRPAISVRLWSQELNWEQISTESRA
ncbi:hypothetical protein B0H11DRAFT_1942754 [Mycena galericulata]|nr:hypothetical protein B0H11DRAFT_1942754 [Mycena galericulata]